MHASQPREGREDAAGPVGAVGSMHPTAPQIQNILRTKHHVIAGRAGVVAQGPHHLAAGSAAARGEQQQAARIRLFVSTAPWLPALRLAQDGWLTAKQAGRRTK